MEDCLESLPGVFVAKNAVAQDRAIGCPINTKNGRPELLPQGGLHGNVACQQLVRTLIRIEYVRTDLSGQSPRKG